ncbi:amino acid ABC transporter permease [[Phormidium ambiguum] IAM M-71]|uniref:Amino acid ABC transporter permease n=1 Tax=[Phormidium ambiguum] IAM M-71 TaxID=454136 RepID=A0A1U7IF07_9CYAN|nr:ABC transporter permease subunit [Phormidium ambiguum]OKH35575.1 amino acid ABC transporter permease [Phormidium ambiguum IAM M-71]
MGNNHRFWRWAGQILLILLVVILAIFLWGNFTENLQQLGLQFGFDFLNLQAGFDIGEKIVNYKSTDTFAAALFVGLINSLRVMAIGLISATIVGVIVGIARLSDNWLVRKLAMVYVEILRNTPLLLQLLFWYFAIFLKLPQRGNPISLFGIFSLSNQGLLLPGGTALYPEFLTLILGLTLYTGAFIAEIIRGGIQAVPKGQWEAAKSLGLTPFQLMRLVIFPQALRVIIPPLTSQYLNLAKNSSLAIAIGFPDIYAIASTTNNITGRAVEVIVIIIITYLTISLSISLLLNFYNRRIQIKER